MILLPQGLKALKRVAKQVGAELRGASRNLDGGCDTARHRHGTRPCGTHPQHHRGPLQAPGDHARAQATLRRCHPWWRMRIERTLAWENPCQRWWLRVERLQRRHAGMKVLA